MISCVTSRPCGFASSGMPRWRLPPFRSVWVGPGHLSRAAAPYPKSAREFFFKTQTGQGHKQVSQGHQAHVVVPTRPGSRLVLRHAEITLTLLEILLDAIAR